VFVFPCVYWAYKHINVDIRESVCFGFCLPGYSYFCACFCLSVNLVRVYVNAYVYLCAYMYIYMYVCICKYLCVCKHVGIYLFAYVCIVCMYYAYVCLSRPMFVGIYA